MHGDENDGVLHAAVLDRVRRTLSEVEASDFERLEPPADLWDRIEAAILSDPASSPRVPPGRTLPPSTVVEYWIDAHDVLVAVGQSWADFARDNDAPELAVPPSDRTLWTYFDTDETRELWQLLVRRVRASGRGARVPLRCDAPHARRWLDMTMTPEPNGVVHFRSVLAFEEPRAFVSLLDLHAERDERLEPVALCSWCARGRRGALWLGIEELVQADRLLERSSVPPIVHGICTSCREEMSAELLVPDGVDESTA